MANPNIPNLCGANPNLNGMLSEIDKLKDKLLSSIDVDASELKADLETSLGDLKAAFDKLEIELPEAPNVDLTAFASLSTPSITLSLASEPKYKSFTISLG